MTSFRSYLLSTIVLLVLGWGGLAAVLTLSLPTVWPRWSFFFLWILALTGTALPFVYFLNRRFPSVPPVESPAVVRQATWVGIYGATLAWLQLGRLVTIWVIFGLAGGLFAIEYSIRLREQSHRRVPRLDIESSESDNNHAIP